MEQPIPLRPDFDRLEQHLYRAAFAACHAAVQRGAQPMDIARRLWPEDTIARVFLARAGLDNPPRDLPPGAVTKADQTIGTTTVSGWASELARRATGAFLGSLSATSAAAALMADGVMVPLEEYQTITVPARSGVPTAGVGVQEGSPIPVRMGTLAPVELTGKKVGIIVVISRELARRAAGEAMVAQILREDAAVSLDTLYFSTSAATSSAPPGLLYGLTSLGTGIVPDAMADLAATISANGSGRVTFIMSPSYAAAFPIRLPTIRATVLPSLAVPDGRIIAVDAPSLVHGFSGLPDISASQEDVLHMSDDPAEIVAANGTIADPTRSLFQTASIALRLILPIGFAARRSGAVAFCDGVQW
jgi:hypothetical protein